jgi:serine phosphatase RsbU (regulator of sigma subunit)
MPSLLVMNGTQKDAVFGLVGGETLGRDQANTIVLTAPGVSRKHLQFVREGTSLWLVDLGSANGTHVNGSRVMKHKLAEGDVIALSSVSLKFHAVDADEAAPSRSKLGRRPAPPTEPLDTGRARQILLGEMTEAKAPASDYTLDARVSFTATSLGLSDKAQIASLQKRLELLFEIQQALAAVKDLDELLGKMMDKLFQVFPQTHRGLVLLGPTVDELDPAIVRFRNSRASETGPTISRTIAHEVFEQRKAILAHDAEHDVRFAASHSLVDMHIRSFIVAPLLFRDEVFGFIQLDTDENRKGFTPDDLNVLAGLASSAALFLKSVRLFETVARDVKEREAIHSELRVASRIQAGLLPKSDPEHPRFEVSGRMHTAKEVGGDYYDYLHATLGESSPPELFLVIGDVSGKGVPAGLVMVMARSILRSLVARGVVEPKALAIETNRLLIQDVKPGMFLSLLIGRCDGDTLRFAGCGHDRPLVYREKSRRVERVDLGGLVLGIVPDNSTNVAEAEVKLEPGDQVLLFTDGVPEAMDPEGKQYTIERLEALLATRGALAPAELLNAIEADVAQHVRGAEAHDDITLIAVRRKV